MQSSKPIRKFIRHPSDVPIRVAVDWVDEKVDDSDDDGSDETLTNLSIGGLAFISSRKVAVGQQIQISFPILDQKNFLVGTVVWCEQSEQGYEVGLEFESRQEVFRLRMIEQICHIEHYRNEIRRVDGRELTMKEAASEWIKHYASEFPSL